MYGIRIHIAEPQLDTLRLIRTHIEGLFRNTFQAFLKTTYDSRAYFDNNNIDRYLPELLQENEVTYYIASYNGVRNEHILVFENPTMRELFIESVAELTVQGKEFPYTEPIDDMIPSYLASDNKVKIPIKSMSDIEHKLIQKINEDIRFIDTRRKGGYRRSSRAKRSRKKGAYKKYKSKKRHRRHRN